MAVRKQVATLYVDRSTRHWIVRDPDGNFWVIPPFENGWEHRLPFEPHEGTELEPVPGHYKYVLRIPF